MDLPNALMQLARNVNLLAVRPRGVAIAMTPGLIIMRVGVPQPYRWSPGFKDLIADDWSVGTVDKMRAMLSAE